MLDCQVPWVLQPSETGLLEFRPGLLLHTSDLIQRLVDDLQDVELVKRYRGILERILDAADEGRGHVATGLFDVLCVAAVSFQIFSERGQRCCVFARGGEKDLRLVHVNEHRDVVMATFAGSLVHAHGADPGVVLFAPGLFYIVVEDSPNTGVVLSYESCYGIYRHLFGHGHDESLKEQRESTGLSGPRYRHLFYPTVRTLHPRGTHVEVRNMLEEIEVPPDFVQCVIRLTATTAAFGTGELAAPGEIDVDVELLLLGVKRTALHQPRWKQAKGHLKEVGVLHREVLLDDTRYQKQTPGATQYKMMWFDFPGSTEGRAERLPYQSESPVSKACLNEVLCAVCRLLCTDYSGDRASP